MFNIKKILIKITLTILPRFQHFWKMKNQHWNHLTLMIQNIFSHFFVKMICWCITYFLFNVVTFVINHEELIWNILVFCFILYIPKPDMSYLIRNRFIYNVFGIIHSLNPWPQKNIPTLNLIFYENIKVIFEKYYWCIK